MDSKARKSMKSNDWSIPVILDKRKPILLHEFNEKKFGTKGPSMQRSNGTKTSDIDRISKNHPLLMKNPFGRLFGDKKKEESPCKDKKIKKDPCSKPEKPNPCGKDQQKNNHNNPFQPCDSSRGGKKDCCSVLDTYYTRNEGYGLIFNQFNVKHQQ